MKYKHVVIAILIGLLAFPSLGFAGGGGIAAQPDWEINLTHNIRPSRTVGGNDIGEGTFARASIAYGWVQESVVAQDTVTAANNLGSYVDGQAWFELAGVTTLAQYAGTGYRLSILDDEGRWATARLTGAVGGGETLGANMTTDGDFESGTTEFWVPYHSTFTNETQDGRVNVAKIVATAVDNAQLAQNMGPRYVVGKLYKMSDDYWLPSTNTKCDGLKIRSTESNFTVWGNAGTQDAWTTLSGYQVASSAGDNIITYMLDGIVATVTIGDILYIDNKTVQEVTECSAQGIHVNKVSDGTEGWDYDASFAFNNITAYIITKDDSTSERLAFHAVDMPRVHATDGILLEPVGVNKALYCRDLSQAGSWTATGTSVQTQTGIDGEANKAWLLTDIGGNYDAVYQTMDILANTNTTIGSFYILKNSSNGKFPGIEVKCHDGGVTTREIAMINTETGAIVEVVGFATGDCGIEDYGDWWRVWASLANDGSNTKFSLYLYYAIASVWGTINAATTGYCAADWFQVEFDKKFPSAPKYTEGSEATQATESGNPYWTLPTGVFAESLDAELHTDANAASDPNSNEADATTGWTGNDGTTVTSVNTDPQTGTYHFKLTNTADSRAGASWTLSAVAGTLYKFSAYLQGVTAGGTNDRVGRLYIIGYSMVNITLTADTWVHLECYIVAKTTGNIDIVFQTAANELDTEYIYLDNVSVKEVTNSWNNLPPHGTVVLDWEPGYDQGDTGETYSGILSTQDARSSVITSRDDTGLLQSYDGTSPTTKATAYAKDTSYKVVVKFGYLTDNVLYYRVGVDSGTGVSWGTAAAYDGVYVTTGNIMYLAHTLAGPMKIKLIRIYKRILSDGEINAIGFPE